MHMRTVIPVTLIAAALTLSGCAAGSAKATAPATPKPPAKIAVHGVFVLTAPNACGILFQTVGYEDIHKGTEVVIGDDAGKTLAITKLTGGTPNSAANRCTYKFAATVPAGLGFYQVTVSHRGAVKMAEAQMAAPNVSLGT